MKELDHIVGEEALMYEAVRTDSNTEQYESSGRTYKGHRAVKILILAMVVYALTSLANPFSDLVQKAEGQDTSTRTSFTDLEDSLGQKDAIVGESGPDCDNAGYSGARQACIYEAMLSPQAERLNFQAVVLAGQNNFADAIPLYQQATRVDQDNPLLHEQLGVAFSQVGNVDAAIASYQRALEIDPDFSSAHFGIGGEFFHAGRVDEAKYHLERHLELSPDTPYRGDINSALGR